MKIFTFILSILACICLPSCNKTNPYEHKICQLRETVLFYECNDFSIFAYPELCENPSKSDGTINELEKVISFKLCLKNQSSEFEICNINFKINDKTYKKNFEYSPLASFLYCRVAVENLPQDDLFLKIDFSGKSFGVKLLSLKDEKTVSYQKILDSLKKTDEFVNSFFTNKTGELKIRFIDNNGYDYWYLGFIEKNKTLAYLIDGETTEILAIKQEE